MVESIGDVVDGLEAEKISFAPRRVHLKAIERRRREKLETHTPLGPVNLSVSGPSRIAVIDPTGRKRGGPSKIEFGPVRGIDGDCRQVLRIFQPNLFRRCPKNCLPRARKPGVKAKSKGEHLLTPV